MMRVARMLAVLGVLCAALLTLSGCRSNPHTAMEFDLLHQELRQMEDYIYHLEDQLARTHGPFDQSIQPDAPAELFPPSVLRKAGELEPHLTEADDTDNGELQVPDVELGNEVDDPQSLEEPFDMKLPPDELPEPNADLESGTDDGEPPMNDSDDLDLEFYLPETDVEPLPDDARRPIRGEKSSAAIDKSIDAHVTHVVFNRRLTGGTDLDGRPGDDGLTVVLEPRNAAGRFVPLAGSVTVVVLDPQVKGEQARVARWEVDGTETARSLFIVGPNRGIHLDLPWKEKSPDHSKLHLFARYETVDGRRLVADQQITIARTGELSSRWTPATHFTRQQRRKNNIRGKLVDDNIGRTTNKSDQEKLLVENQEPNPSGSDKTVRPPAPPSPIPTTDANSPHVSVRPQMPSWRPYR